jgi:hypothetical protein
MTLKMLRETMRGHLVDGGAAPDAIDRYLSRWDAALETDSTAPLPCPDCYVGGAVSRLRRVPSPAGVGIVKCPSCSASFEFPDFQPVATTQGIWPTRA